MAFIRTQSIKIEVPLPKFSAGDFIRYTQDDRHEGFNILAKIEAICQSGVWSTALDGTPYADCDESYYILTVQEGSFSTTNEPLRPGTALLPLTIVIDEVAQKIDYFGDICTPDTIENLAERLEKWKKIESQ